MKYFLAFLIFLYPYFPADAQDKDSLLLKAASGQITAYSTLFKPIPLDSLNNFFYSGGVIVNCTWTRPAFVDNFFQKGMDGVRLTWLKDFKRTKSKKFGREFIVFNIVNIDEYGNFLNELPAFLIKRKSLPINETDVRKAEMAQLSGRKQDYESYLKLLNATGEVCRNSEIMINHKPYKFDSCQYKYQLTLNADLTFTQSYDGELECYTEEMMRDHGAGVEGSMKYAYTLQTCIINNPKGIWTIDGQQLILKTSFGIPVLTLWINEGDKNTLVLNNNEGQICTLKRVEKQ